MSWFGRTFFRGLMVVVPGVVTAYVVYALGTSAEANLGRAMKLALPENYYRPGMGIAAGILLVFLLGVLMNLWLFRRLFRRTEKLLDRIPLVKTLYGSVRDLLGLFSSGGGSGMSQVVTVTVAPNVRLMGLVTREAEFPAGMGGMDTVAVYIPLSYALGGYTILVPRSMVERVSMSVEDALRFAVTAGAPPKGMETVVRRKA